MLLGKTQLARFNETLACLLAYKLGVIVLAVHEHGLGPASVGPRRQVSPRTALQRMANSIQRGWGLRGPRLLFRAQ